MPKKVLPSEADFDQFRKSLLEEGFRPVSRTEFSNSFKRLDLQAPRPREGRETGFIFMANRLTVYVWTTFLEQENQAREEDAGWVVITEGDRPDYYSHPMMRTKGFLAKLLKNAKIAKERVLKRPLCPTCHAFMQITKGTRPKARYWSCVGKSHPHLFHTLPWDYNLSDESMVFLKAERRERRRYREGLTKAHKTVIPAIIRRKPWVVKNPQNKI